MYIFLDIDGVLVKEDAPGDEIDLDEELMKFDETCLSLFETLIRKYDNSQIIISSSWREIVPMETIKSLFSPEVATKILGATPRLSYPVKYFRHKEVLNYLKQHGLEAEPWVAIDDIAEHYPPDAPIVVTNPYKGFDKGAADKLEVFLSITDTQHTPCPSQEGNKTVVYSPLERGEGCVRQLIFPKNSTSQKPANSISEVSGMRKGFPKQQKPGDSEISLSFSKPNQPLSQTTKPNISEKASSSSKICQLPAIQVNHEELIRDYAGYDFIQEEMEMALKRFLELYYEDILASYDSDSSKIERLEIHAAGAGASKFVFGIFGKTANGEIPLIFGIRMYNNIGKMKDEEKIYDCSKEYQISLETYDKKLVDVLIDELKVHQEFREQAKTSIDISNVWARFPLHEISLRSDDEITHPLLPYQEGNNTTVSPLSRGARGVFIDQFAYIEDCELKRLMVNLGINAITVGDFVVGFDGKKILGREEFLVKEKIHAIIHISNALLQTWLLTLRYDNKQEFVGRTIVDLKPAQFIVQSNDMQKAKWMPAVIIDVGPAENTDKIDTYFKTATSMKKLIPAFAMEMLKKIGLSPNEHQDAKRTIYDGMITYLNQCQENHQNPTNIPPAEFSSLIDEFKNKLK
jgi:hypothetical protein